MRFREHRGTLDESIKTRVELPDRAALVQHIENLHACFIHQLDFSKIEVKQYSAEPNWEYIVSLDGYGVIGFTDKPA